MFKKTFIVLASLSFSLYFISMVAYPFCISKLDWNYVLGVWDTWQTFNAAMIALLASVIALAAATYSENQKRERELIAANALLPEALTQLIYFCKHSTHLLNSAYENRNAPYCDSNLLYVKGDFYNIPEWVSTTFHGCIITATKSDAIYMASVLAELQIIRAQLTEIHEDNNKNEELIVTPGEIISHIRKLGRFVAQIDALFPYARQGGTIVNKEINNEMINNGLSQIDAIEDSYHAA